MSEYINFNINDENIDKDFLAYKVNGKSIEALGDLGKVNIFIGANNSGKSRFMRYLLKHKSFLRTKNQNYYEKIRQLIKEFDEIYQFVRQYKINISFRKLNQLSDKNKVILNFASIIEKGSGVLNYNVDFFINAKKSLNEKLNKKDFIDIEDFTYYLDFFKYLKYYKINQIQRLFRVELSSSNLLDKNNPVYKQHLSLINNIILSLEELTENEVKSISPKRYYIPILRGAIKLYSHEPSTGEGKNREDNLGDIYRNSTFYNYDFQNNFDELDKTLEIFTGRMLHDEFNNAKSNSTQSIRKQFEEFESFISGEFLNNKKLVIIPTQSNHIQIEIQDEDRTLPNIGDGIQSIIVLVYKLFIAEKGSWFFIEEPETHLHPGLQRLFLDFLINNETIQKKDFKIFFTTHSNHLVDIAITENQNVSIFTFEKQNQEAYLIKNVPISDDNILDLLGVNNSSVLMSNCSIWVEGESDRKYIKSYLEAYYKKFEKKKFRENIEYTFFLYAGSNVAHYCFTNQEELQKSEENIEKIKAQFLANKILLIADKDKNRDNKHALLKKEEGSNFEYEALKVREVENLLSWELMKDLLLGLNLKGWKVTKDDLNKITVEETKYETKYLKEYIVQLLEGGNLPIPNTWQNYRKGTFSPSHKQKLANLIYKRNITWEDMSKEAQKLTERVYKFIEKHNKKVE